MYNTVYLLWAFNELSYNKFCQMPLLYYVCACLN